MKTYWLKIELESDAAFGRGDGVAGKLDAEVQHDQYGLPYLGGKTLKGLLTATCAEVWFALKQSRPELLSEWEYHAQRLFGSPGSQIEDAAILHVGDAKLPQDLRAAIAQEIELKALTRKQVLGTLTTLRRQTAMDPESGAPLKHSLRTVRVILRKTPFVAQLNFLNPPDREFRDLALLAACVKAFRRAGSDRNRGRGRLSAELYDCYPFPEAEIEKTPEAVTDTYFEHFEKAVLS